MPKMSLNEAIIKSGIKKHYIAEKLGVPAPTISAWVKNPSSIKIEKAIAICELIKTSISEIDFSANAEISKNNNLN